MKDFNFNVVNKKKKVIDYFVRPHSKCTSLVIYLPPPNFAFCNDVSREIEDSADAKFLGANKVYYGARANGAFCCSPPPPLLYTLLFLNSPGTGPMYYLGEKTVYREEMETENRSFC